MKECCPDKMDNCMCMDYLNGMKWVIAGLALIVNEMFLGWNWFYLIGGLLIVKGIVRLTFRGCVCHPKNDEKPVEEKLHEEKHHKH